jgi:hypothetical protein
MSKKPGPKVRCRKCGDVLQSQHVHDFKWCKCKSIAVDGGSDYLRLVGNLEDAEVVDVTGVEDEEAGEKE